MDQATDFPVPGTVLWGLNAELGRDVFRQGAATKPNTDYLRYSDLGIDTMTGRIEGDAAEKTVIREGFGISLFLTKVPQSPFRAVTDEESKTLSKNQMKKINWWAIDKGHPMPSGLVLKYDGNPPGHCTLTVTRSMTVVAYLELVKLVPFVPAGVAWSILEV